MSAYLLVGSHIDIITKILLTTKKLQPLIRHLNLCYNVCADERVNTEKINNIQTFPHTDKNILNFKLQQSHNDLITNINEK